MSRKKDNSSGSDNFKIYTMGKIPTIIAIMLQQKRILQQRQPQEIILYGHLTVLNMNLEFLFSMKEKYMNVHMVILQIQAGHQY